MEMDASEQFLRQQALDIAALKDTHIREYIEQKAMELIHKALYNVDGEVHNRTDYRAPWYVRQKYIRLMLSAIEQQVCAVDPDAYVGSSDVDARKRTMETPLNECKAPGYENVPTPEYNDLSTYITREITALHKKGSYEPNK